MRWTRTLPIGARYLQFIQLQFSEVDTMKKFHPWSVSPMIAMVALLLALGGSARVAHADWVNPNLTFTTLTLVNGWTGAPFGSGIPAVNKSNGIVHFKGAMAGGTAATAFTLPAGMRPHAIVYLAVDMCNATNGRLVIDTGGVATVQAETSFSNAQCFTSLDGVSFAP
jgi:hypothetical protein